MRKRKTCYPRAPENTQKEADLREQLKLEERWVSFSFGGVVLGVAHECSPLIEAEAVITILSERGVFQPAGGAQGDSSAVGATAAHDCWIYEQPCRHLDNRLIFFFHLENWVVICFKWHRDCSWSLIKVITCWKRDHLFWEEENSINKSKIDFLNPLLVHF